MIHSLKEIKSMPISSVMKITTEEWLQSPEDERTIQRELDFRKELLGDDLFKDIYLLKEDYLQTKEDYIKVRAEKNKLYSENYELLLENFKLKELINNNKTMKKVVKKAAKKAAKKVVKKAVKKVVAKKKK